MPAMVQLFFLNAESNGLRRRVKRDGREYVLAPSTIIVPGVLNGSRGPLLYPPEENSKNPQAWHEVPLVVYHPTDKMGRPLSASAKGVFERSGIGHFRNPVVDNNGVLRGISWFDLEKTKQVDPRVYDALLNNKPIELSTGLYTENKPAPEGATWKDGRSYHSVATNYKPDHVAILPDQVGACSLNDGCGVHNHESCVCGGECDECKKKEEATYNVAGEDCPHCGTALERDPYSGKCNHCGKDWPMPAVENKEVEKRVSIWRKIGEMLGLNAGPMQYKCPETGKWLPYGAGTGKGDVHKAAMSGGSGLTGSELEGTVQKAAEDGATESEVAPGSESDPDKTDILNCGGPGGTMGPCPGGGGEVSKVGTKEDAIAAASNLKGRDISKMVSKVTDLKSEDGEKIGFKVLFHKGANVKLTFGGTEQVVKGVEVHHTGSIHPINNTEGELMNRSQVINWLTTNCECWKGEAETLNKMTDNQLTKLKKQADAEAANVAVVNAVREISGDEELAVNAMPAFMKEKMAPKKPAAPGTPTPDEEEETEEGEVTNKGKRLTPAQFEEMMPAEYLETWNASKEIVTNATKAAVGKLKAIAARTTNAKKKKLIENKLAEKPLKLSVLNDLLVLTDEPVANRQVQVDNADDDYSGAAGAMPIVDNDLETNASGDDADNDPILMPPTMNYEVETKEQKQRRRA